MKDLKFPTTRMALTLLAVLILTLPATGAEGPLAAVSQGSGSLYFSPLVEYGSLVLTVSGGGQVLRQEFAAGEPVVFSLDGLADDSYTWELRAMPSRSELRARLLSNRELGELAPTGGASKSAAVQTGYFTLEGGVLLRNDLDEPRMAPAGSEGLTPASGSLENTFAADIIQNDDVIITGSLCVGFDCVNGENFGFDTIRLKENNLRIKFQDTSNSGSFPSNDWQITANDSSNGGANKFSIDDIDGGRTPFTIEASAPSNSLYVDDGGRLGLGTSTPVVDIHAVSGNTPTLRLEQNGSSGFTPQTWDVAGNETNFFIRDVTNGSKLPFRIRPGAPTSSIDIASNGNVGIGTASPSSSLHVSRSDGTAKLVVQENSGTTAARTLMTLENNGPVRFVLENGLNDQWSFTNDDVAAGELEINYIPNSGTEVTIDGSGNMVLTGMLTDSSSREVKENFAYPDPRAVLDKVNRLEVPVWSYISDDEKASHMGPISEQFYELFGLGADDKHIAPGDKAGVALAAIKGLNQVVEDREAVIDDLKTRVAELEALVQNLLEARK